jgi:hypothetical protein
MIPTLQRLGHDIWITSSRVKYNTKKWNKDLLSVVKKYNIPEEQVQLTEGAHKYHYLEDFDLHFDDDLEEILLINKHLEKCKGILVQ